MPTSAAISCMLFLVPRSSSAARFILTHVKEARLWEVLNSYLYTIEMDVVEDGVFLDRYTDRIGIRTINIEGTLMSPGTGWRTRKASLL